jgi:hypothetical protein
MIKNEMYLNLIFPRGWRPGPPGLGCPAPGAKLAGVYLFTHTLFDLQYIGSAMNFYERIQLHRKK